jgi:hypothetical protein
LENDLELVLSESRSHVLNAVFVGRSRDMVEEGWCGPVDDFLVNLEDCATADFLGVEYIVGGDGTVIFECLDEEGDRSGGAPWVVPSVGSRCIERAGWPSG